MRDSNRRAGADVVPWTDLVELWAILRTCLAIHLDLLLHCHIIEISTPAIGDTERDR